MRKEKIFLSKIIVLFKPFWIPAMGMFFIMIAIQLLGTLSPFLFGKSVDAVIHQNTSLTFFLIGVAFIISMLSSVLLSWFREHIEIKYLNSHIEASFSFISMSTMFGFSVGQHVNEHSGVRLEIVNNGRYALTTFMRALIYTVLPNVLQILVTITALFFFDWRVALSAIVFVTIYVFFTLRENKKKFPKVVEVEKKNLEQSKLQFELFQNSTLVINEAQEKKTLKDFSNSVNKAVDFEINMWLDYLKKYYRYRVLIILGQYATLSLGVYFILKGDHSTGMFVTLFYWTSSVFGDLTSIVVFQPIALSHIVEINKFFDLLSIQPDININENGLTISDLKGKIEFRNVSFTYPYRQCTDEAENEFDRLVDKKEKPALVKINFTIPAGSKVAFVGASGSGKSTIINLIRRYYDPMEGEVLIDDVLLKDIDLRWLRRNMGNVEQKISLFDRSVRDNILYGLPNEATITDERLHQVLQDASLIEFVAKLQDNGLDTVIGESGIRVSGGERQRIGIARALIKNPNILIFDEATSALDSVNERLIYEAIYRSRKGRTTIVIAHRLSTVIDADIIFVVANGRIVASGTHAELEHVSEEYKELVKNQSFMI